MIESTHWCIYLLDEEFNRSRWAISCMESWISVAIWAVCWRHDRPHGQRRIQRPDNSFKCSGDGDATCDVYSSQLCNVCESLCHECGQDHPNSQLMVWGNGQDLSSPEKLRPSMGLHFSGKWIISKIVFIADIVHQAVAMITCFRAAMVYHCKTLIDSIYGFQTQSPTEIRKMVAWLQAKDRFTWPTTVCEESSKFPLCLTVVLIINLGVLVLICSDWNCGSHSPDILLWHTTNGNDR